MTAKQEKITTKKLDESIHEMQLRCNGKKIGDIQRIYGFFLGYLHASIDNGYTLSPYQMRVHRLLLDCGFGNMRLNQCKLMVWPEKTKCKD